MEIDESIELYKMVGQRNADFLFKWLHCIYSTVFLPCIDLKFKETLASDKTKLTIFDVLVDDLADNDKTRNEKLLEQFIQIPWNPNIEAEDNYIKVGRKIWQSCIKSINKYPRFREFERMFFFDLRQVLSSMEYSFLVNTLNMDNSPEDKLYLPHGCMVILHCDMDLMCSPDFNKKELGIMRIIFSLAQRISHIGNMLNTYPRELQEHDLSSPIISLAIRKGLIRRNDKFGEKELEKIKALEEHFKKEANASLEKLRQYEKEIKSVDMNGFSNGLKGLFEEFLNRKKYWEIKQA